MNTQANIITITCTVKQHSTLKLPQYIGSMLRGCFGQALKELCINTDNKAYDEVFAHNPSGGKDIAIDTQAVRPAYNAINPYVIKAVAKHRRLDKGQTWQFDMVLIGHAIGYIYSIIQAWQAGLANGLGDTHTRSSAELLSVHCGDSKLFDSCDSIAFSPLIYMPERIDRIATFAPLANDVDQLTLDFITPFRLKHKGKILSHNDTLEPTTLLYAIYNRVQSCNAVDNIDWDIGYADFNEFKQAVAQVHMVTNLCNKTVKRYSSRQKDRISLFCLSGTIVIKADNKVLQGLYRLLMLGSVLHIGKNTTLGLGWYVVEYKKNITS